MLVEELSEFITVMYSAKAYPILVEPELVKLILYQLSPAESFAEPVIVTCAPLFRVAILEYDVPAPARTFNDVQLTLPTEFAPNTLKLQK